MQTALRRARDSAHDPGTGRAWAGRPSATSRRVVLALGGAIAGIFAAGGLLLARRPETPAVSMNLAAVPPCTSGLAKAEAIPSDSLDILAGRQPLLPDPGPLEPRALRMQEKATPSSPVPALRSAARKDPLSSRR
jgi:hypothetical protein